MLEVASPFAPDSAVVRVREPPTASKSDVQQGIADGTYARPFVLEEGANRSLFFEISNIQSVMRVDAPNELRLAYTRKMMAFLLFQPRPARLLLLGLGGGSLAKFCYHQLPAADIDVVEIDPDVIALREEFRVPPDGDRFRVIAGDGAAHVARAAGPVDVLLMDAYDRDGISAGFTERSFYTRAAALLAPDGVFVMNVCGDRRGYAILLGYLRTAFGGRVVELSAREDGNLIVFGFNSAVTAERPFADESEARALKERHGLDFPLYRKLMKRARLAF